MQRERVFSPKQALITRRFVLVPAPSVIMKPVFVWAPRVAPVLRAARAYLFLCGSNFQVSFAKVVLSGPCSAGN
jgi:hypothetical protein